MFRCFYLRWRTVDPSGFLFLFFHSMTLTVIRILCATAIDITTEAVKRRENLFVLFQWRAKTALFLRITTFSHRIMDKKTEAQLQNPPTDIISSVKFGPNSSQFLLVTSWDCTVRLYDTVNNTSRQKFTHDAPVLDCAFQVSKCHHFGCLLLQ